MFILLLTILSRLFQILMGNYNLFSDMVSFVSLTLMIKSCNLGNEVGGKIPNMLILLLSHPNSGSAYMEIPDKLERAVKPITTFLPELSLRNWQGPESLVIKEQ